MRRLILSKKGVTLVELIAAVSLLAIIVTASVSFYYAGTKTFNDGKSQALIQRETRFIAEHMASELRNVEGLIPLHRDFEAPEGFRRGFFIENSVFKRLEEDISFSLTHQTVQDIEVSLEQLPESDSNSVLLNFKIEGLSLEQQYILNYRILLNNLDMIYFSDKMTLGESYSLNEYILYYHKFEDD